MDSLIAIVAAILYALAVATIVPGLSAQSQIKQKRSLSVQRLPLFSTLGYYTT